MSFSLIASSYKSFSSLMDSQKFMHNCVMQNGLEYVDETNKYSTLSHFTMRGTKWENLKRLFPVSICNIGAKIAANNQI